MYMDDELNFNKGSREFKQILDIEELIEDKLYFIRRRPVTTMPDVLETHSVDRDIIAKYLGTDDGYLQFMVLYFRPLRRNDPEDENFQEIQFYNEPFDEAQPYREWQPRSEHWDYKDDSLVRYPIAAIALNAEIYNDPHEATTDTEIAIFDLGFYGHKISDDISPSEVSANVELLNTLFAEKASEHHALRIPEISHQVKEYIGIRPSPEGAVEGPGGAVEGPGGEVEAHGPVTRSRSARLRTTPREYGGKSKRSKSKRSKSKKNKSKKNKTKKNKTKPKKHRNTRKNKIIGGLGENLGRKGAEALGDAARDVAHEGVLALEKGLDAMGVLTRGLRTDIQQLFELIGNRKTEASALAKLLKLPKAIIGVLQDVTVGSQGAPGFITEGLQALGAPIKQLNWAANALSYAADKIPKHEKAFSFMGADMYFNFVSTGASLIHSAGGFVSSSYVTAGLVTFNLALETYPNVCGIVNTSFPENRLSNFTIKDVNEAVDEAGKLDCIREYLLMKFYESLNNNTSNIVKIKDGDSPEPDDPRFSVTAHTPTYASYVNPTAPHSDILSAKLFISGKQPVKLYIYDTEQITENPNTNPPSQPIPFESLAEATRYLSKTFHTANTLSFNKKEYIILKNKSSRSEKAIRKTFLILKTGR